MLLYIPIQVEVCLSLHIVLLVFCGHVDIPASWNQVDDLWASEIVVRDRECLVEGVNITLGLQAPVQTLVEIIVEVLEILETELLTNEHLVDTLHEVTLKVAAFKESFSDGTTDELEVTKMITLYA